MTATVTAGGRDGGGTVGAWLHFAGTGWRERIDVRDFVRANHAPYEGDAGFLTGATDRVRTVRQKVGALFPEERREGIRPAPDAAGVERVRARLRAQGGASPVTGPMLLNGPSAQGRSAPAAGPRSPCAPGRHSGTLVAHRERPLAPRPSESPRDFPLEGMKIMAVHDHSHRHIGLRLSFPRRTGAVSDSATVTSEAATATAAGTLALAGLRVLLGFVFLWAFLDKVFGFGYATPSGKGWIDGGSPTKGFLGSVAAGPMKSTFHSWAGDTWADWLFMLGLLGIGVALIAGIGLRLAAPAGTVMMALMWMAEWPPAKHLSDGTPSMSTNPFADYHLVYALALIALAATGAGGAWGLGRLWARLPFVSRNRRLL